MSTEFKILSQPMVEEIRRLIEERIEERLSSVHSTSDGRYITVAEAARLSSFEPQTIRAWLYRKRIRNYGRRGSPRVLLSEILNLD